MAHQFLTTRRDGPVEYLTLNRPEVRNAFNEQLIAELTEWASHVRTDRALRAVVLAGAGPVFCAGADVAWMSRTIQYSEAENLRDAVAASHMFTDLDRLPVPLIGRIHGAALGGGAGLAAVCDIAVADDLTVFGFTEVTLGIIPAVISPFVVAKIGRGPARELFLTGAKFSAARAKEIGLVHATVPAADVDASVDRYVRDILTGGPEAIATAKALIQQVWERSVDDAAPLVTQALATRRVSPEGQEGLKAFLEKRKPTWSIKKGSATEDREDNGGHGSSGRKP
jgi:methylglutaconyl-CoA hydratase